MALVNTLEQSAPQPVDNATVTEQPPAQVEPENAQVEEQTPAKLAGRFNSVEELEAGYDALNKQQGSVGQELGALRTQLADQNTAMQNMMSQPEQPATDYNAMRGQLAEQIDNGDMTLAQGLLEIRKVDAQEMAEDSAKNQESVLADATQKFQDELASRDEQALSTRFHEQNPEFAKLQDSGVFENIRNQNEFIMDDYQAYLQYQATQAFDNGKNEATKEIEGSAPASNVASSPGSAMKNETPVSNGRSLNKGEMLTSGIEAWNNAGG